MNKILKTEIGNVLAVITARGGSVGIPGKNIKMLGNRPLIAWSISECAKSLYITDLIISTDSEEIAEVARTWGGIVPFMRPSALAQSTTSHVPVMQHAVTEMERIKGITYKYVVIIQPTSPFRKYGYIDELLELMLAENADSGVTVYEVDSKYHPTKMKKMLGNIVIDYCEEEAQGGVRRQDLEPVYKRSSDVYITERNCLMDYDRIYGEKVAGYVVDSQRVVDIDTLADWEQAESIAKKILD